MSNDNVGKTDIIKKKFFNLGQYCTNRYYRPNVVKKFNDQACLNFKIEGGSFVNGLSRHDVPVLLLRAYQH